MFLFRGINYLKSVHYLINILWISYYLAVSDFLQMEGFTRNIYRSYIKKQLRVCMWHKYSGSKSLKFCTNKNILHFLILYYKKDTIKKCNLLLFLCVKPVDHVLQHDLRWSKAHLEQQSHMINNLLIWLVTSKIKYFFFSWNTFS